VVRANRGLENQGEKTKLVETTLVNIIGEEGLSEREKKMEG